MTRRIMRWLQGVASIRKDIPAQTYIAEPGVDRDTQHLTDVAIYSEPANCAQYNCKVGSVGHRKHCYEAP